MHVWYPDRNRLPMLELMAQGSIGIAVIGQAIGSSTLDNHKEGKSRTGGPK